MNRAILKCLLMCYLIILVGIIPDICHAYFKKIKNSKSLEPVAIPISHNKKSGMSGVAVYQNRMREASFITKAEALQPAYLAFAPLDVINLRRTIPLRFRSSLSSKNQLTQLIYANLKFKKLIEEYSRLQRNIHSRKGNTLDRIEGSRTAISIKGSSVPSLYEIRQSMEMERQELERIAFSQNSLTEDNELLLSLSGLVSQLKEGIVTETETEVILFGDKVDGGRSGADMQFSKSNKSKGFEDSGNYMNGGRKSQMRGKVKRAPVIINFFASVIGYFLENKVEAIFYLFIFTTIILILTTVIKQ